MSTVPIWRRAPEVGTVAGIRFVVALAKLTGRATTTRFLWILAVYYAVFAIRARRASKEYLRRVGEVPTFANVVRHVHTFARVALDRLFFLRGELDRFVFETEGKELLAALAREKKGALLLGSHLGSFEALRAEGASAGMPLSIVVDSRSAERLTRVLRELAPAANIGVIAVDPSGVGTALQIRDAIERGELVGILSDRTLPRDSRNVTVDFLGAPAELPAGPFVIAHTLRCPVYQVCGLFHEPNRYALSCTLFAERIVLERSTRAASLQAYAQKYADALAQHARRAPYNWFNFFPFWRDDS